MEKYGIVVLFIPLLLSSLRAQQPDFNLSLVGQLDYEENCNDIWGYVGDDGTEYAILGTTKATVVISLANPSNPQEIAYIEGTTTNWRDMKSWANYIYAVADGNVEDGLLVIDMSSAPDSISHHYFNPDIIINTDTSRLKSCHNLYIDENGFCYMAGCNVNNGAVVIFDLNADPEFPAFVGATEPRYSHDAFVRGDTLWSSDIFSGFFSVIDVSDKANPQTLATQETSSRFTHNSWLSDDGKFLFTTDELEHGAVDAYDVSDLSDIKRVDSFRPAATEETGVLPHNVHFKNGFLVISHYSDGLKIVDAHRPHNLIEVASYDTYEGADLFGGNWGAYPFLPSGIVLASDRTKGLLVFQPTYQQACYLEGTIRDEDTGIPLNGVLVEILNSAPNRATSDALGVYNTGQVAGGTFEVAFSLPGYFPKTLSANLNNGALTLLNVTLKAKPRFSLNGVTLQDQNGEALSEALIFLEGAEFKYEAFSNANGQFDLAEIVTGEYKIYAGKWGYRQVALERTIDGNGSLTIRLPEGYQDDFILDLGWTVSGDALRGNWERGKPIGTFWSEGISNPDRDIEGDFGDYAYVTGNLGGSVGFDDVDEGHAILSSPVMALRDYTNPTISYYSWFYNASGNSDPNDTLNIYLTNGVDTILLEEVSTSLGEWRPQSIFAVKDFIALTDSIQLIVETSDFNDRAHLVEAALDAFLVTEGPPPSSTRDFLDVSIQLTAAPNPFGDNLTIAYELENFAPQSTLLVYNIWGQQIAVKKIADKKGQLTLGSQWLPGIYLIRLENGIGVSKPLKVIKTHP